jgi:hypothetical protein
MMHRQHFKAVPGAFSNSNCPNQDLAFRKPFLAARELRLEFLIDRDRKPKHCAKLPPYRCRTHDFKPRIVSQVARRPSRHILIALSN